MILRWLLMLSVLRVAAQGHAAPPHDLMNIHGTFFRVLSVNGIRIAEPFTRDTVLVGPKQTVVIGFVQENRGVWLTYCHIQSHAESGMMTTIDVD